jgi:sulfur-carrier protein
MSVKILFFASLAEITGTREMRVDPAVFPSVGSVFDKLVQDYPSLDNYRSSALFALNSEFARLDSPIKDGDELAFFPPVSGG